MSELTETEISEALWEAAIRDTLSARQAFRFAYRLGRAEGMRESAEICRELANPMQYAYYGNENCAKAIEKARKQ